MAYFLVLPSHAPLSCASQPSHSRYWTTCRSSPPTLRHGMMLIGVGREPREGGQEVVQYSNLLRYSSVPIYFTSYLTVGRMHGWNKMPMV
ncbi:uncharacterized protein CLUP02_08678 [Colletotrichum lupini]|uniref:Uncharacterized protein n=1 Tax=Colletotrichum lupini TaxID=145971 RepID=A0A9Q8WH36_9PEZI|nr:uncharacterized protein CLUP02_08678 [Colletotrichum lupini]KAK1717526.1 hypothetical protein BDP67DRAFT_506235 [Colletotrichum lupini]UQC83184.1 hypothetical protein CLUP02_08678 [Colletotrichum lupini]